MTGRSSEKASASYAGPVHDVHGVSTRIKYDPNLNPPFVILTSMPEPWSE